MRVILRTRKLSELSLEYLLTLKFHGCRLLHRETSYLPYTEP